MMDSAQIYIDLLLKQLNVPYVWGGKSPLSGMDCSGFAIWFLKRMSYLPPQYDTTAQGLFNYLLTQPSKLRKEPLGFAFFGASRDSIRHVSIILNDRLMIEAEGDSTCKDMISAMKWRNGEGAYIKIHPINRRTDLVGFIRPIYKLLGEISTGL